MQGKPKYLLNEIAVLNLTFLIGHQIDAAYWHEWEMFKLPGGIQFYNVFNLVLFAISIGCLIPIIERRKVGRYASIAIASCSVIVLPIHSLFALAGFRQFDLPVSILLILGTFILSIIQMVLTLKFWHDFV